jgi:two-component system sensor histidine kinase CpxA
MINLRSFKSRTLALRFLVQLIIYAMLLLTLPLFFLNARFGLGWEAILRSPAGERIDAIAYTIASQLAHSDFDKWTQVLDTFGSIYNVRFYLFYPSGDQVAGESVHLPGEVAGKLAAVIPPFPAMPQLHHLELRHFRSHCPESDTSIELPSYVFEVGPPEPNRWPRTASGLALSRDGVAPLPSYAPEYLSSPRPIPGPPFDVLYGSRILGAEKDPLVSWLKNNSRFLIHTKDPESFWICSRVVLTLPRMDHPVPLILVASTDNLWNSTLLLDLKMSLLTVVLLLSLSILFWLPFIYQLTKSLSEVARATELIADGRFETRVQTKSNDEIGRLAEAVNSMAARIHSYVSGQKRLMGDISHELCSPIARLQMALEILRESASDEQQSLLKDISEEVNEMNNLVSELLAFSKAEIKGASSNLSAVAVLPLIEGISARCGGEERITIDVPAEICVMAEANLLDRALSNLVRNSLRYAGEHAHISIAAAVVTNSGALSGDSSKKVAISIRDNGPGVPEESLASLGEPFFRPEASRNRSFGGVGLGLAIVKSCAAACNGTTVIRNLKPHGFEVQICLEAATNL